jgi:peroxiredoxin
MHQKYAAEGVVCISVSVDALKDQEKTLKFLTAQKANFQNFLLDEKWELWQDRWNLDGGPPITFVFDREGRRVSKFFNDAKNQYEFEDVDKVVQELLKSKK